MEKKYKIVLSLVIVFVLLFGRNSMNITAQASGDASDNNAYVLAYYDIATKTETMLTAKDVKQRFGINVNSSTLTISSEPQQPLMRPIEEKLSDEEKSDIADKDEKGINYFNTNNGSLLLEESYSNKVSKSARATIGETRSKISNPNTSPYYSTAKIYSSDQWIGTGFAVGYNLLATARHCLQNDAGWKSSITAYFGYNGNKGTYFYKANNAIGYIYYPSSTIESSLQDWAFVVWNTNTVYSTGCYGMKGDGYNGMAVSTVGYPQDLESGNYMYKCSGTITSCNDYDFWSDLRVYNGQSGSPVYEETSSGAYAIAIMTHSYFPVNGTNNALSRRIDSGLIGWLIENEYA